MGKNKQEKQAKNRASSSLRAREQVHANGFIGFDSFRAPTETPGISSAVYDGQDHEISLAVKQLGKKGSVTKLKALSAMKNDIIPNRKPAELRSMLGPFAQLYANEIRDQNDGKVRLELQEVLLTLTHKMKPKAFSSHLKRMLPSWEQAKQDPVEDVASVAKAAYDQVFLDDTAPSQVQLWDEYVNDVLEHIQMTIKSSVSAFPGVALEEDDQERRYERCVASCLFSLTSLIEFLCSNDRKHVVLSPEGTVSISSIVTSDAFGKLVTASSKNAHFSREGVRKASYAVLLSLTQKAPELIETKSTLFARLVLGAFSEKHAGNHHSLWELELTFLQSFPSIWGDKPTSSATGKFVKSAVFPRFLSQLRHGFHGSSAVSFPSVLPFLSLIPQELTLESTGKAPFYVNVLDEMWKFVQGGEARGNEAHAIRSYFECFTGFFSYLLKGDLPWEANGETSLTYVQQFQKPLQQSLRSVLQSPGLPRAAQYVYMEKFVEMIKRLESTQTTSTGVVIVKTLALENLPTWVEDSLLTSIKTRLCVEGINALSRGIVHAFVEKEEWLRVVRQVYGASLMQLHSIMNTATSSADRNDGMKSLLNVINALYALVGVQKLLDPMEDETVETHFQVKVRPLLQSLSAFRFADTESWGPLRLLLKSARYFVLATDDKKRLLLELIQDVGVQQGALVEATALVEHTLSFSSAFHERWLSFGSWQPRQEVKRDDDDVVETLAAVWSSKVFDEFLMLSLKSGLDHFDADQFASLLKVALGGRSRAPVVSPDAVLILAHHALGKDVNDAQRMTLLPSLITLFTSMDTTLPKELADVQVQLYARLFQFLPKGMYKHEAETLWSANVVPAVERWDKSRRDDLVERIASDLNASVSEDEKEFALKVKHLLLLSKHNPDIFPLQQLGRNVHVLNAANSKYSRVLTCMSELCDDKESAELVATYLSEVQGVETLAMLVDMDVVHALTWSVYHSDPAAFAASNHPVLLDTKTSVLGNYMVLETLYDEMQGSSLMDKALELVLKQTEHHVLVKASRCALLMGVESTEEVLTEEQEHHVSAMVAQVLSTYASTDFLVKSMTNDATEAVAISLVKRGEVERIDPLYTQEVSEKQLQIVAAIWKQLELNGDQVDVASDTLASVCNYIVSLLTSSDVVSVSMWTACADYISYMPSNLLSTIKTEWTKAMRAVIMHCIGGRHETAHTSALKLHQLDASAVDEASMVQAYSKERAVARLSLLHLLQSLSTRGEEEQLQELAGHYREALLSSVLCSLSEGVSMQAHLVSTYMDAASPSQTFSFILQALYVKDWIIHTLHPSHMMLQAVHTSQVKELVLSAFGGVPGTASLFDASVYPMSDTLRALLYTIVCTCGALAPVDVDVDSKDMDVEDEDAAETTLVEQVVPESLRHVLETTFTSDEEGGRGLERKKSSRRRLQRQVESRQDLVSRMLLWDIFLQQFPSTDSKSYTVVLSALSSYANAKGLLSTFLLFISTFLSETRGKDGALEDAKLLRVDDLQGSEALMTSMTDAGIQQMGARVLFRTAVRMPSLVRTWWNDECDRSLRSWMGKYFEESVTPVMLANELETIRRASENHKWDADEMGVRGSRVSREIITSYVKDECTLEMVLKVPPSYPLRSVEVECTKRIGISEDRWRRWVLQIMKATSSTATGSLLDAVLLWKQNVDKEFDGVEPCPICYSILNPKNMALPSLSCKTCSNAYHSSCLYKWFTQSGKNKCPICQQPFH